MEPWYTSSSCMIGRIHNGDTIGFIRPIDFYLGIKEELESKESIIYPNPASLQLMVDSQNLNIREIKITDIRGNMVKTITEDLDAINVADLPTGLYLIIINTEERIITQKFAKQ